MANANRKKLFASFSRKRRPFFLALSLSAIAASSPQHDAAWWAQATRQDINAAYRLFLDNHPGVHDPDNPAFAGRLMAARNAALALVPQVTNAGGYAAALARFTAALRDGHAQVFAKPGWAELPPARWPGFVAAWRGDALYVFASEPGGPPQGARIEACDGRKVRDLVLDDVFAFEGRPDEPGQWWVRARNLFVDDGNPFVAPPRHCRFLTTAGSMDMALTWRVTDAHYAQWRAASYNGDILPTGLREVRPGLFWVAMPSFDPDAAQRDALRAAFATMAGEHARLLTADAIVIDLRGNQGGSSDWSWQFAQALWGKDLATQWAPVDNSEVWWRASPDNMGFMAGLVPLLRQEKQTDMADWASGISRLMRAAMATGKTYAIEPQDPTPVGTGPKAKLPSRTPPIYVIVPGQCSSACLDALDRFTAFPRVKLIGAPSSADTTYLDIRKVSLPGGRAQAVVPMKLYRHRPRAAGQVYQPAIQVTDLAWSTAAFQAVVEKDLKKKGK